MNSNNRDRRVTRYLLMAAGLILAVIYFTDIVTAAGRLWGIISPVIMGFIYAYILNILIKKIDKHYFPHTKNQLILKTRKPVCILLAILVILLAIVLIIYIVLPQVINAISSLIPAIEEAVNMAMDWFGDNEEYVPNIAKRLNINLENLGGEVTKFIMDNGSSFVTSLLSTLSSLPSMFIDFFISMAIAIYFLAGKDRLIGQLRRIQKAFMKPAHIERLQTVLVVANETFTSYIGGQFTEALVLGTLCTAGMFIFGFPYATTIGVFIGATALIPIVGAYLGAGVGALLILMVDPVKALFFLIYIVVLQQLENNLIYPRVVGTSIGLPGLWVMVAVVVGGGLGGIAGMMLGVPIAATAYKLLQHATRKRLAQTSQHSI